MSANRFHINKIKAYKRQVKLYHHAYINIDIYVYVYTFIYIVVQVTKKYTFICITFHIDYACSYFK